VVVGGGGGGGGGGSSPVVVGGGGGSSPVVVGGGGGGFGLGLVPTATTRGSATYDDDQVVSKSSFPEAEYTRRRTLVARAGSP
jgi:hypothetical protein